MKKKNRICEYSKCSKEYHACFDSIRLGGWKSYCCTQEHYQKWQTEIKYHRGEDITGNPLIAKMVAEGALPDTLLPKQKKTEPNGVE